MRTELRSGETAMTVQKNPAGIRFGDKVRFTEEAKKLLNVDRRNTYYVSIVLTDITSVV